MFGAKNCVPDGFFNTMDSTPYPKLINFGQQDFILIGYEVTTSRKQASQLFYDTVSIQGDHIMRFTRNPSKNEITRIDFKTNHCFGTCPVFELSIDKNLNVDFDGIYYTDKKGKFKLKAEQKHIIL